MMSAPTPLLPRRPRAVARYKERKLAPFQNKAHREDLAGAARATMNSPRDLHEFFAAVQWHQNHWRTMREGKNETPDEVHAVALAPGLNQSGKQETEK